MLVDPRCLRDGAYCRDQRSGILYRCLGERIQEFGRRFGYEDVAHPDEMRWVTRHGMFAERLRFVCQGEPLCDREVVEAMR